MILDRDHGFPVRVLVPGVTGARSVKWLGKRIFPHSRLMQSVDTSELFYTCDKHDLLILSGTFAIKDFSDISPGISYFL